jgi:hypothetical protein
MIVADGRQPVLSEAVSLNELADIFLSLGCIEALNLDGGGSSGMAVGNQYVSSPSEQRAVPSILAITARNKLNIPGQATFEEIIDTESPKATKIGTWSESANSGFFGTSKSLISAKGDGSNKYQYNFTPSADEYCDVFAWWVASTNRGKDTPFIIKHKYGETVVNQNQTANGSAWVKIGTFVFKGDGSDQVTITNAITQGDWAVADAVRIVSFGEKETPTFVENEIFENQVDVKCFPNPFSQQTQIELFLAKADEIKLEVFNNQGQTISILANGFYTEGKHSFVFDAKNLAKGIYFYKIQTPKNIKTGKLIVN